ncbi:ROK family protein [Urbifossiella limnaea]|uniref:Fructokinase n=1 Tax=Urbifossiella limnaea TaxID=2528023 RepID=A0A517XVC3_9BACT|nr:ROK family protein [Urbifossiella limnaea]QDU21465.1 Putative fructokinase [Urbifossiella limnaea]
MLLGIEIGGTKLQLGLGRGDGTLVALWRGSVESAAGGDGIRRQIVTAVPELLKSAGLTHTDLRGVGVGFGGPTDDTTQRVIKSHHVAGWDDFPLADWVAELTGLPTVICNDADVAALAEATHGAGRGLSPLFYMTVGTGIGGGLVIDGKMYRGCGRGAVEIGHLRVRDGDILEAYAAGWGIAARANRLAATDERYAALRRSVGRDLTGKDIATAAAAAGDPAGRDALDLALDAIAEALGQMIKLLCPRRVVIGGGVSLMGDELFFEPLRRRVSAAAFPPFAGLTDIVPAALGEEVVIHGALALARQQLGG